MTITITITDPKALLKFLDSAEPTPANPIPQDIVTIADAIEAKMEVSQP